MEAFDRQRRNLIVISIAIIIYIAAGGDIQNSSILGSTITITDKGIIKWFTFIAYLYSFWRFRVYLPANYKAELRNDFHKSLSESKAYKAFASKRNPGDDEALAKVPFMDRKDGQWRLDYDKSMQANGTYTSRDRGLKPAVEHTVYVSTSELFWAFTNVLIRQTIHHKSVSDYVVPVLLFIIAFGFVVYRYLQ